MKNLLYIFLLISCVVFAQVPQGFTYQAVAVSSNGLELVNQNISIRASILSNSATGDTQWIESHQVLTDNFGLFMLIIGQGTPETGALQTSFSDIEWGTANHYIKIEMDVLGGSDYQLLGISQLMSVPYALYAGNTDSLEVLIDSLISTNTYNDSLLTVLEESISSVSFDSSSGITISNNCLDENLIYIDSTIIYQDGIGSNSAYPYQFKLINDTLYTYTNISNFGSNVSTSLKYGLLRKYIINDNEYLELESQSFNIDYGYGGQAFQLIFLDDGFILSYEYDESAYGYEGSGIIAYYLYDGTIKWEINIGVHAGSQAQTNRADRMVVQNDKVTFCYYSGGSSGANSYPGSTNDYTRQTIYLESGENFSYEDFSSYLSYYTYVMPDGQFYSYSDDTKIIYADEDKILRVFNAEYNESTDISTYEIEFYNFISNQIIWTTHVSYVGNITSLLNPIYSFYNSSFLSNDNTEEPLVVIPFYQNLLLGQNLITSPNGGNNHVLFNPDTFDIIEVISDNTYNGYNPIDHRRIIDGNNLKTVLLIDGMICQNDSLIHIDNKHIILD